MTGIEAETRESSKPVMFAISEYYAKPYKGLVSVFTCPGNRQSGFEAKACEFDDFRGFN